MKTATPTGIDLNMVSTITPNEKQARVTLDLMESGTLCHLLMQQFIATGGIDKQPQWAITLYRKLTHANDRIMGKRK